MKKKIRETNITTVRYFKIMALLSLLYLFFVCVFVVSHQLFFSHGQLVIFAIFGLLLLGRSLFVLELGPFILFFLGYELLRGLIPYVVQNVHIFPMIRIDQFIFGTLPNIKLQALLYHPPNFAWYDYLATLLYIFHAFVPIVAGYFFWLKNKEFFKEYALGFLILCYSTFMTYVLFPAMPPWLASIKGYVPPIHQITTLVEARFLPTNLPLSAIYTTVGANPVAAIPSLHAAFPFLIFLFVWKKYPKASLLVTPYVVAVWLSVMYLGEHYFTDVILGALYALFAFIIVQKKDLLLSKLNFRKIP